ncbi:tRNA (adenosine(37)-N6)-dimethylallyltransferase MiaA [Candidatus Nomurabacteria bacterium RIFCSPLOWO2_01_FULL_42_20]|nr:MAG: tRNA (adenosine(37)-N6)-dimethylallyltransferase MiaA [Candidatus Nomurabacteria bacterium RIFCSPLOWO2_01_FULL_42_20]
MKPKIIVILGQTATGKSNLAVKIAKQIGGEIISADSRQVYKGLDLGTGKITKKEMMGVPHHLLDVVNPRKSFSVAEYKKLAEEKIEEILKNGKIPIIAGGTGLYIKSIVDNISFPEVPPNETLRKKLKKLSAEKLFALLKKIDPRRAQTVESKNPRRLIRAIEIAKALGKVPRLTEATPPYKFIKIGLKLPDEILKKKIKKRLEKRLRAGMAIELHDLRKKGVPWKRFRELGFDQKYIALYLQNKISQKEMLEKLLNKNWQYAKRQWTWFKRDKKIIWIDPTRKSDLKKLENKIKTFLQ